MNTKELKLIIQTAEDLGYDNIPVVVDESRDGTVEYVSAEVSIAKDVSGKIILAVRG